MLVLVQAHKRIRIILCERELIDDDAKMFHTGNPANVHEDLLTSRSVRYLVVTIAALGGQSEFPANARACDCMMLRMRRHDIETEAKA